MDLLRHNKFFYLSVVIGTLLMISVLAVVVLYPDLDLAKTTIFYVGDVFLLSCVFAIIIKKPGGLQKIISIVIFFIGLLGTVIYGIDNYNIFLLNSDIFILYLVLLGYLLLCGIIFVMARDSVSYIKERVTSMGAYLLIIFIVISIFITLVSTIYFLNHTTTALSVDDIEYLKLKVIGMCIGATILVGVVYFYFVRKYKNLIIREPNSP